MAEWNPRANAIFLEAVELTSAAARADLIAQRCAGDAALAAEVESLLACHEQGDFLDSPPSGLAPIVHVEGTPPPPQSSERPGMEIGRYKLRELIGEGGMGAVWIAEQTAPVRRRLALKVVKAGMDSKQVLSRFEAERQALALMDHPNIAKVFDGGMTASGRPFFVMEYVKGVPITQYCDQARLTVKERLQLFVQVCQAVQHAHQKGIIHRDLKPSNILVCLYDGLPVPKVIDFGLAKAMNQPLTEHTLYTAHGLMVGTPLYMSPEQAEFNNLDVDTRTDVYSLGVILYELLTGSTPLERQQFKDAAFQEILRLIKEEEPQKPSTKISGSATLPAIAAQRGLEPAQLSRLVRGDLDWIVMRTLEKERSRRYETPSSLARDLGRYLDDEPVEARPPSLSYKLGKLARRNKRALATAALLGIVVLGALTVVAGSIGWAVRDRQNRQAVVERQVNSSLDEFAIAVKENQIGDARAALKQAEGFQAGSDVRSVVSDRVRQCKADLKLVERLEEIQLDRTGDETDAVGQAAIIAAYRRALDEYGLSLDELEPSLAAQRIRQSAVKEYLLAAVDDWAISLPATAAVGDGGQRGPSRSELLTLATLADNDPWRKRLREAIQTREISQLKQLANDSNWKQQRPLTLVLLADQLSELGDSITATDLLARAAERHANDFCINQALGFAHVRMSSWELSSLQSLRCLQQCRDRSPNNWAIRAALGWAYFLGNDVPEAEKELREAIRLRPDHATAHLHLGEVLEYLNRHAQAAEEYHRAMRLDPQAYEPCRKLAEILLRFGKFSEAEKAFREAINASPQAAPAYFCLGDVLAQQNKSGDAQAAHEQGARLDSTLAKQRTGLISRDGNTFVSSGQLEDKAKQYAAAVRDNTKVDSAFGMQAAVLCLHFQKRLDYERLCRQMLDRFGETESAVDAHRTSLVCLLSPSPVGDLARLEQLAERATTKGGTGKHALLLYGRGRGLAAYRAGRWQEAIKWCAESRAAGQGSTVSPSVETQDMVIEAMAHHKLGNAAEARRLYLEAARLIHQRYPDAPTNLGQGFASWFDWVLYQILRQQAAALLGISPAEEANSVPLLLQRGLVFAKAKDTEQASANLVLAVESPAADARQMDSRQLADMGRLWLESGKVLCELGRKPEAAEAMRRALDLLERRQRKSAHDGEVLAGIATAYVYLGSSIWSTQRASEAQKYEDLALAIDSRGAVNTHRALAHLYLSQGHWDDGARHLEIVMTARPFDHLAAMQAAVLQLHRGDQQGYDRVCRRMLKLYGDTRDPTEADRTAKACLLANPPVGDLAQLVKLAETAVSDPTHGLYRFFALARALAEYRKGDWEAAQTWCREGQDKIGDPKQVPYLVAHYCVVQAMAQHRTGQFEQAKSSLLVAHKIIRETYPDAPLKLTSRWPDWMLYDVLCREAEQLIEPSSPNSPASSDQPLPR